MNILKNRAVAILVSAVIVALSTGYLVVSSAPELLEATVYDVDDEPIFEPSPIPESLPASYDVDDEPTFEPSPTPESLPTSSPTPPIGVNAETFALLSSGMSIVEVQEIIGVTPTSEVTTELLGTTSTMIMWRGEGLSAITVMFTNGYATTISQMGL